MPRMGYGRGKDERNKAQKREHMPMPRIGYG
jgi:hypothetical protein